MRLYALVQAGDPEAVDVYLAEEDAQRALEDCLRDEPQWRKVHTYTRAIGLLDEFKRLLTGAKDDAETHAEGGEPVATPPGEEERETSTNAQMMGSSDEPWSGND
jgi:hypothetical protein